LLPATRGELLSRLGRSAEARAEFQRAADLSSNARERAVFTDRADFDDADRGFLDALQLP
jgi:predicted RNA polymerase sigma factor